MIKIALAAAIIALPAAAFAEGSPYLPIPGSGQLTAGFVNQSGEDFYVGKTKNKAPSKIKFNNLSLNAQYGLTDELSIDGTFNYARSSFAAPAGFGPPIANESALGDTTFGVKWRVIDEFEAKSLPTLTLRAGAIIKGTYKTNRFNSINDGASGVELSALLGKYLTPSLSVSGELGYRTRNNSVPSDVFGAINLNYSVNSMLSGFIGYNAVRSNGDLDIGAPGFSPARFQQVREDRNVVQVGVGYNVAPNVSLGLSYGKVTNGRNTIKDDIIGLSVSTPF
jgi:hypothetical protein